MLFVCIYAMQTQKTVGIKTRYAYGCPWIVLKPSGLIINYEGFTEIPLNVSRAESLLL